MFPNPPGPGEDFSFTKLRNPSTLTVEFTKRARQRGFDLRFHDLRGTHETLLLDAGVPVHVVAARCGHDPAVLLRSYAKRTRKADTRVILGDIRRPDPPYPIRRAGTCHDAQRKAWDARRDQLIRANADLYLSMSPLPLGPAMTLSHSRAGHVRSLCTGPAAQSR
jgi:hypothetical protein